MEKVAVHVCRTILKISVWKSERFLWKLHMEVRVGVFGEPCSGREWLRWAVGCAVLTCRVELGYRAGDRRWTPERPPLFPDSCTPCFVHIMLLCLFSLKYSFKRCCDRGRDRKRDLAFTVSLPKWW